MTELEKLNAIIASTVAKTVSMYPNSKEVIGEMKTMLKDHIESETDELNDIKKTARNFFLANMVIFLSLAYYFGQWVGVIETRQLRVISDLDAVEGRQNGFDERIQKNDVASAEVRTKLSAIEATLVEIRQALRGK